MGRRYLIDKSKCECGIEKFFANAAEVMGMTVTNNTIYDCRKICVSEAVYDHFWEYYSEKMGYSEEEIASILLQYGPKVMLNAVSYCCFEVEYGFVVNKEEDSLMKKLCDLYRELETLLNTAPTVEDRTDQENAMYYDMTNLKERLFKMVGNQL